MKIRIFSDIKVSFKDSEDILKKNVIYKLTFPNGKIYIGQTGQLLRKRITAHCSESFQDIYYYIPKSNAIRKYMQFEVEVLYQGEDLDNQEIYWINYYNTLDRNYGYNLESGGCLNKFHSEETKLKMSLAKKGKTHSEETKLKIRQSCKDLNKKSIIVTEIVTGIEKEFDSLLNAANFYNISRATIGDVLNGRSKTFKKRQYIARYK